MKSPSAALPVSLLLTSVVIGLYGPFATGGNAAEASRPDIGTARDIYDGILFPDKAVRTYGNTDKIFPTRTIRAGKHPVPLPVSDNPITA